MLKDVESSGEKNVLLDVEMQLEDDAGDDEIREMEDREIEAREKLVHAEKHGINS